MGIVFGDVEFLQEIRTDGSHLKGNDRIRFVKKRLDALYDERGDLMREASSIEDSIDEIIEKTDDTSASQLGRLQDKYSELEQEIDAIDSKISKLEDELEEVE